MDFHHALGAVVHCEAFFTEHPLADFLTRNPVAVSKEFDCNVISDEQQVLLYLRSL